MSAAGVLVLLSASDLPAATSGINRWSPSGLAGVSISRISVDPRSPLTLFAAGGAEGLYRSTDGGATWGRLAVDAAANPSILDVAVTPSNPSVVFAGGPGAGFFKSVDGGSTWARVGAGLPSNALPIVVAPAQPTTVYAGAYRSIDGGETFSPIPLPVDPSQNFTGIVPDPNKPSTIYSVFVGGRVPNGGVFKSLDGGATWIDTHVPDSRPAFLTIDPTNSSILYESDLFFANTYKSTDGGATWTSLFLGGGPVLAPILIDPAAPSTLYALIRSASQTDLRIHRSSDGGATWQAFQDPLPSAMPNTPNALAIDSSGLRLYLATSDGIFARRIDDRPLRLLDRRFQVALDARDPRTGRVTVGLGIPQGDRFGYFSLPEFTGDASFPEVVVKMADATALPALGGTFWFFHASLTDVEYILTVTDTVTGATRTYKSISSPGGQLCGGVDTNAFPGP